MNRHHKELVKAIRALAGRPSTDAFLNNYLGNPHVRYSINTPTLRALVKEWSRDNRDLSAESIAEVVTSLVEGESFTEKVAAGILLGYTAPHQRSFDPSYFNNWLDHLIGWAEVDALCSGDFPAKQVPVDWARWKKVISSLSKDETINKRRASLVLFCSPVSKARNETLAIQSLKIVDRLKHEKEVMITKAISWVLRSLVKHHRSEVENYLDTHEESLPRIAVREVRVKLDTGRKTQR